MNELPCSFALLGFLHVYLKHDDIEADSYSVRKSVFLLIHLTFVFASGSHQGFPSFSTHCSSLRVQVSACSITRGPVLNFRSCIWEVWTFFPPCFPSGYNQQPIYSRVCAVRAVLPSPLLGWGWGFLAGAQGWQSHRLRLEEPRRKNLESYLTKRSHMCGST